MSTTPDLPSYLAKANDSQRASSSNQNIQHGPTFSHDTKKVDVRNKDRRKNRKRNREGSKTLGEESDCSLHEASSAAHRARKMLKLDSSSLPKGE